MAIKNVAAYRLVVAAVTVGCATVGLLTTHAMLMPAAPNPDGVQLESLMASCVSHVVGISGLVFGLVYGKRLAFELYNERTPETNDSSPNTAVQAVRPDSEPL